MYKFHIYSTDDIDKPVSSVMNRYPQLEKYELEDGLFIIHSLDELIQLQKDIDQQIIISSPESWEPYYGRTDVVNMEIYDDWRE